MSDTRCQISPCGEPKRPLLPWMTLWAGLACLTLAACGYQLVGTGPLPGAVQRIAVKVLTDRTAQAGIQTTVTNALIHEFTRRRPDLVVDIEHAEAVLSGTILSLESDTVTRRSSQTAVERRVVISVQLTLNDKAGQVLWEDRNLRVVQAYAVSANQLTSNANRLKAIDLAAERMAESVYERLTSSF